MANASAYDLTPEGMLLQTLEVVDDSQSNQGKSTNEIHSGTGHSVRQSTDKIRAKVTGDIRFFKYGVMYVMWFKLGPKRSISLSGCAVS
ncbi:hypothetical protein [Paenibacillus polymyxa]|uniref:hypothetical protein n=1 Tax=Paenibacillus polymyxa TaxID=1406 RepID=UPI00237955A3|nr:hypothetical protein [Paenibacillus polymyxa]